MDVCTGQRAGAAFTLERQRLFGRQCVWFLAGCSSVRLWLSGALTPILQALRVHWAPASRRLLGKSQRAVLAPVKSVGVLLFVASLQISLMKAAGLELLEQHSGDDCKQRPNQTVGGELRGMQTPSSWHTASPRCCRMAVCPSDHTTPSHPPRVNEPQLAELWSQQGQPCGREPPALPPAASVC